MVVDEFRGKAVNDNLLTSYCQRKGIQPITAGEFSDYVVQVEHDEVVGKLFPLILAEVQKLHYIPEFASQAERKKKREENDAVRVEIAKLMENDGIKYMLVDTLGQELGRMVGQTIEQGGRTIFNKATEVLLNVARERFGGEFTTKHAAEYAENLYAKKTKVSDPATPGEPAPTEDDKDKLAQA